MKSDLRGRLLAGASALVLLGLCLIPSWTRDPDSVLRFMIWGTPEEISVVQGFLKGFRKEHPEIPVQVEAAPSMQYPQKLHVQFLGGNPPDVMYLAQENLEDYAARDWLLPLDERVARDAATLEPEDFYPSPFERFRYQGKLYGICKDFATLVLYYNKDLFDKWGVPYPKAGWTWEDFLRTAQALSREGDYGFLLETWPEELFPWIWQAGGEVASDSGEPRWLMGAPEYLERSAEGLQFLSDLIWKYKVAPNPGVMRNQGGNALFLRGKAAMCTYGRWACMEFRKIRDFDWGVVELPRRRRQATSTFAVSYVIAKESRQPDKAWTLVQYLTSKAAQREVAHSVQAIPSRRSVAESEAFRKPRAFSHLDLLPAAEPHTAQVPFGRFSPRFRGARQAKDLLREGLEPLWNGTRRDARAILRALQPKIEAVIARAQHE